MTHGWTAEELQLELSRGRGSWATFHYPAGARTSDDQRAVDLRKLVARIQERWPGMGIGIQVKAGADNRLRIQFLPPPGSEADPEALGEGMRALWEELTPGGRVTLARGRDPEAAIDVLRQWRMEAMNGAVEADEEEPPAGITPLALQEARVDG
jgi:hypothetical protein